MQRPFNDDLPTGYLWVYHNFEVSMSYRQVTERERYYISAALAIGLPKAFIDRELGRHRGAIQREIKRNRDANGHYKGLIAHGSAKNRLHASRRKFYFTEAEWSEAYEKIAHRSWERGSVENMNGLIRQYPPKWISLRDLTQGKC